ncbi:ABC-F family ATP-binding cassette domain-containing protein [Micromonospora parathelypteridis]|uniref:Macrolide transport system ATP-binding/permease protein n=1 Tax=Micromonospora parathelypteridis TaxID=1839617 RepID=A0A840VXZ8_9ACTN|nr:ABC-F family ATP-binding cassette domain-containing protein [Micromonospora parathelypteridis]MBB5475891.1 macrolide transport system ATP-binding/permease protein [Micromonospora parathelypteridis]GGO31924.1 ABC transporter ATP-binding protein [Micromonospora parathelypteridis]
MSVRPALIAYDLVRSRGTRRVLDGVSLTAAPGRRIGLIGENGTGKTTLLRVLAGVDEPDSGTVVRPPDLGFLHQELPFTPSATVAGIVDDALREARADLAELDRTAVALTETPEGTEEHDRLLSAYGEVLERAQDRDAWDADRRALTVLAGLGLGEIPHDRRLAALSGGQRGRLALAAMLIRRPAALLLDEPTNHLDDAAAAFCEEQLRAMPGVVVVASHDRAFLDAVCTDVIDLDPAVDGPVRHGGNYTTYLAAKRAEAERWRRRYDDEQALLADLREAAAVTGHQVAHGRAPRDSEKMGYGHTAGRVQNQISRRVRDAARRLETIERAQIPAPPEPLRFHASVLAAGDGTEAIVTADQVEVPGRLRVGHLEVLARERLLVSGPNGAGKSTLLAVLAGNLSCTGAVWRRPDLRVGLLSQDSVFPDAQRTARQVFDATVGTERAEVVALSSLGLLAPTDLDRPVAELSVGQRRRLGLAVLVADPPELLLLDEPTNHLSPRLCDELEEALGTGPGAIVVASHDRRLRSRWQGREITLAATVTG